MKNLAKKITNIKFLTVLAVVLTVAFVVLCSTIWYKMHFQTVQAENLSKNSEEKQQPEIDKQSPEIKEIQAKIDEDYKKSTAETKSNETLKVISEELSEPKNDTPNIPPETKTTDKSTQTSTTNSKSNQDTSATEEHILKVPFFRQIYNLSCEAASLQMALAYRGVSANQDQILAKIGVANPYIKEYDDKGQIIWGDPNIGFVGNVKAYFYGSDGSFKTGKGWGVNNGPVARVAAEFRSGSYEVDGANIDDLKNALRQNKPVIFWHGRDDAKRGELLYKTPEGKEIKLFQNHVNVLTGFSTKNGSTRYYFNDPIYGKYSASEAHVKKIWARYNNEIVVVN
jgi:uncharacterized protein YvpB